MLSSEIALLPHDIIAEESVLGCLLLTEGNPWPECAAALRIIQPRDFYRERNCWIWEAILACRKALDRVTVAAALQDAKRLEDVGGRAYLSYLVSRVPTPYHAEHYARRVKNMAERRRAVEEGTRKVQEAFEGKIKAIPSIFDMPDEPDIIA